MILETLSLCFFYSLAIISFLAGIIAFIISEPKNPLLIVAGLIGFFLEAYLGEYAHNRIEEKRKHEP
jgi:hypothetical protein